jgi:hypothetical protein
VKPLLGCGDGLVEQETDEGACKCNTFKCVPKTNPSTCAIDKSKCTKLLLGCGDGLIEQETDEGACKCNTFKCVPKTNPPPNGQIAQASGAIANGGSMISFAVTVIFAHFA